MSDLKISQLPNSSALDGTELLPVVQSGTTKQTNVSAMRGMSQLVTPTTGFNISVTTVTNGVTHSTWLLLTPAVALTSGNIVLPTGISRFDGQWIAVTTSQQITGLTVNGSGAAVSGAPKVMGADASFKIRYSAANNTWYRCD